MVSAD
jgi:hypothetical protein